MYIPQLIERPAHCKECGSHLICKEAHSPFEACSHVWTCGVCRLVLGPAEYKPEVKPTMTDDERLVMDILNDDRSIMLETEIKTAYIMVATLQLATRHPHISDWLVSEVLGVGRAIQKGIDMAHPGAYDLLEKGWNSDYDVELETQDDD